MVGMQYQVVPSGLAAGMPPTSGAQRVASYVGNQPCQGQVSTGLGVYGGLDDWLGRCHLSIEQPQWL